VLSTFNETCDFVLFFLFQYLKVFNYSGRQFVDCYPHIYLYISTEDVLITKTVFYTSLAELRFFVNIYTQMCGSIL